MNTGEGNVCIYVLVKIAVFNVFTREKIQLFIQKLV